MESQKVLRTLVAMTTNWKRYNAVSPYENPLTRKVYEHLLSDIEDRVHDGLPDVLSDIASFVIDTVGVDAVLVKIPDDWEMSSDDEAQTKRDLAWQWLWDKLHTFDKEPTS